MAGTTRWACDPTGVRERIPLPPSAYTRPLKGNSLSAVLAGGQVAAMGQGQDFPFKMGAASSEMCNALVAAAGDPECSDQQRRRRVLHCLDLGVPVDYEDEDGASSQTSLLGTPPTIRRALSPTEGSNCRGEQDFFLLGRQPDDRADGPPPSTPGVTPMLAAAVSGHNDVIKLLIEHGADVNLETLRQGGTALIGTPRPVYLPLSTQTSRAYTYA